MAEALEKDSPAEQLLFPPSEPSSVQRSVPARPIVHTELRRKGVTLELLWQEYKAEQWTATSTARSASTTGVGASN